MQPRRMTVHVHDSFDPDARTVEPSYLLQHRFLAVSADGREKAQIILERAPAYIEVGQRRTVGAVVTSRAQRAQQLALLLRYGCKAHPRAQPLRLRLDRVQQPIQNAAAFFL